MDGSSPWPTPHRLAARITPPTRPALRGPRSPLRDSLHLSYRLGSMYPAWLLCLLLHTAPPSARASSRPADADGLAAAALLACLCTPLLPRPGSVPGLPMRTDQRLLLSPWLCHYFSHEACDSDLIDQPSSCGCGVAPAARPTSRPFVKVLDSTLQAQMGRSSGVLPRRRVPGSGGEDLHTTSPVSRQAPRGPVPPLRPRDPTQAPRARAPDATSSAGGEGLPQPPRCSPSGDANGVQVPWAA